MPENEAKSSVSKREDNVIAFWNERDIFNKTLTKEAPLGDFVFYDGPPFATGTPHYGHLLQSAVKDAIPRYKTMRGFRVARQWGWDCHGLPIENIVEKEIGTKSKKDIAALGVKKFNDLCRERIFTFIHEWERIIPRFGRWADMKNPYRTMDFEYMQSEWWAFKKLYDDGLIYEDYRSMHICPRCETTLSQGEVAEGYKDVKDIAVTVKFKMKDPGKNGFPENTYFLAWTTTPWTLPGNVALAIGPTVQYALVKKEGEYFVVAKNKVESDMIVERDLDPRSLLGIGYEPPFNYYKNDPHLKNRENGWKVYAADFVTADAGTGIAHEAPAFGADDWELLKKVNLPFVQHVNMDGTFKSEVKDFAGMVVRTNSEDSSIRLVADIAILKYLEQHGLLFSKENITHSYPHCWRCDTPLLNYATSSWFVSVTKIKDTLLRTAKNIEWSPTHIKEGRWGEWLKGARDWSISRQRFWANTIPVWRCDKCKKEQVFGSADELEKASGKKVTDLHKEIVDEVSFACSCGGTMKRVPDVLDTWFDSGSVPFATLHHPRGDKKPVPADFIGEAQDQTRAWFYYQHVLTGALFGTEAFKHCIVTGVVLAEDGKKMSKKLQNYPDPMMMIEKYGADAMRFYMLSSPVTQAENLSFSEKGVDEILKKNINRLNNVLEFYKLYADGTTRSRESTHVLDKWILARLDQLVEEVTDGFEKYQPDAATRPISGFIDDLSVWYLRRSRDRFKEERDKKAALGTFRHVLYTLACVIAPSMPFFAEYLFQEVKEEKDSESIHLVSWPVVKGKGFFAGLFGGKPDPVLENMQVARDMVSRALEARDAAKIKVRQPLASYSAPLAAKLSEEYLSIIADEINVKIVKSGPESLDTTITDELREEGVLRDTVREIQAYRKERNMKPGEPATYRFSPSPEVREVVERNRAQIKKATQTEVEFE